MRLLFVVVALALAIASRGAHLTPLLDQDNCLEDFKERAREASYDQVTSLAQRLSKRDLKCLYRAAEILGAPSLQFFSPQMGAKREIATIFGKNSMPFHNTFEKHVFAARSMLKSRDDQSEDLYGYNFHTGMSITGPGFFKIKRDEATVLIDFTDDFEREIALEDMSRVGNIKTSVTRNNIHNLFYGGETKDYCRRLLYDDTEQRDVAVVCEGYRSFFGHRHAFIWDILIRKW